MDGGARFNRVAKSTYSPFTIFSRVAVVTLRLISSEIVDTGIGLIMESEILIHPPDETSVSGSMASAIGSICMATGWANAACDTAAFFDAAFACLVDRVTAASAFRFFDDALFMTET